MTWIALAILVLISLILVGRLSDWIHDNPAGDFASGVLFRLGRCYVRVMHRLAVHGQDHIPNTRTPGPLIVIANHTAGIDPVLIQSVCPFEIRWIMAHDMREPRLEWFWKWKRIIFVSAGEHQSLGLRAAIEHLKSGGVLGIFPEGGLERPPRQILPFYPGLGLLVRKSGARILPVFLDGTPQVDPAWASLWRPSHSTITFGPVIDPPALPAAEIAFALRQHFIDWSGWPGNDTPSTVEGQATKGRYGSFGRTVSREAQTSAT
jgi:1-acyl-sn-glycerol-3-phosphate acyltransferase